MYPIREVLHGEKVHIDAKRKAKHSRYDWIVWRGRDGIKRAGRVGVVTLKAAMLATGTQERFTLYERRTGVSYSTSWCMATTMYRLLLCGWYS